MPIYDMRCGDCGVVELYLSLAEKQAEIDGAVVSCPECNAGLSSFIVPIPIVGPMPSKPFKVGYAGIECDSASQLRKYKANNPTEHFLDKNDRTWTNHYDDVREKCEAGAKAQGYTDLEDKRQRVKKQVTEERAFKSGAKQVTPQV